MKPRIVFLSTYWIYWLVYFIFSKLLFLVYHYPLSSQFPFSDWLKVIWHGIRLDISMTSWIVLLPFLFTALTFITCGCYLRKFVHIYTIFVLILTGLVIVGDLELYRHWGYRLDSTPLMYLKNPQEVAGSANPLVLIIQIVILLIYTGGFYLLFRKFVFPYSDEIQEIEFKKGWKMGLGLFLLTAFLIIPIRGGLDVAPMNVGTAYFHQKPFPNHAAINVVWNFFRSSLRHQDSQYPKNYFDKEKSKHYFSTLYQDTSATKFVLNTSKPNIIIIGLESYTAKIIGTLRGLPNVSPQINTLSKEGILFDNFYSSGDRTDKGVVSILNGFPAQPHSSIIKYPMKMEKMPYLSHDLQKLGYNTSFCYGYNIDYANFQAFLTTAQFQKITHKANFPVEQHSSKWGVHDHFVLQKMIEELDTEKEPFFKMSMLLSSHEPFEVPMETVIEGKDEESMFLNSAYYTDKSIGEFIAAAKTKSWWQNTLIVLVADHGIRHPNNTSAHDPEKFRIPMLWLGGALAVKDTVIQTFANQTDIPLTILKQLKVDAPHYKYSQNIFAEHPKDFAVYVYNDGFGYLTKDVKVIYDNIGKRYISEEGVKSDFDKEAGKAYLQMLYQDFNEK
jgi:phosphoglycerol transferase MdoB-like AlkP superfamily enzyme